MGHEHIAIVIPVLNEAPSLNNVVEELRCALEGHGFSWTVLFVDDGSTDGTLTTLKEIYASDRRFSSISLSRNFGKEGAIAAGLRYACGDAVIVMDADLEHPPDVISSFIQRWREGYKIVIGQRLSQESDDLWRRFSSWAFHTVFSRVAGIPLPIGVVDFVLLDRKVVNALNRFGERARFSRGLYRWIGFSLVLVPFVYRRRSNRTSRWGFVKLAKFALDGLLSFSNFPLKIWSYIGALISLGALVYASITIISTLMFGADVPGFPSLFVSIMFFAGIQLISLGIIGEYLARIYEEVKGRPLYVVAEEIGASKVNERLDALDEAGRKDR